MISSYLIPCLETHKLLDLVVIMLGTNDLKVRFSVSAFDISNGAGVLVDVVHKSATHTRGAAPQVLLLAPPPVARPIHFTERFDEAKPKPRTSAGFTRKGWDRDGQKDAHGRGL